MKYFSIILKGMGISSSIIIISFLFAVIFGKTGNQAFAIFLISIFVCITGIVIYRNLKKKDNNDNHSIQEDSHISTSIPENEQEKIYAVSISQIHNMSDAPFEIDKDISPAATVLTSDTENPNKLEEFIWNCNRKEHIKPFDGLETCITQYTETDQLVSKLKEQNKTIAFYDDFGFLTEVYPFNDNKSLYDQHDIANEADYFVFFDKIYDISNAEEIKSIPRPYYKGTDTPVFNIEYHLRMHRGRTNDQELETVLSLKTIELMKTRKLFYGFKDYLVMITNIMKVGNFNIADDVYLDVTNFLRSEYKRRNIDFDDIINKTNYKNEDYQYLKQLFQKRWKQMQEYNMILDKLPELAPKSYSGYARMKTMNTQNYQKIVYKMKEKGIDIH